MLVRWSRPMRQIEMPTATQTIIAEGMPRKSEIINRCPTPPEPIFGLTLKKKAIATKAMNGKVSAIAIMF